MVDNKYNIKTTKDNTGRGFRRTIETNLFQAHPDKADRYHITHKCKIEKINSYKEFYIGTVDIKTGIYRPGSIGYSMSWEIKEMEEMIELIKVIKEQ